MSTVEGTMKENLAKPISMELTKEQIDELTKRAVYYSTAIIQYDHFNDPVNYWACVWSKLIILSTVKKESEKKGVNADTEIHSLNWQEICRELCKHTTNNQIPGLLSVSTCLIWYQTRIRIFEYHFPNYRRFIEGWAVDKIIKYYSQLLREIKDKDLALFGCLQRGNLHCWPPSTLNLANPGGYLEKIKSILSPAFCSVDLANTAPALHDILIPRNKQVPSNVIVKCSVSNLQRTYVDADNSKTGGKISIPGNQAAAKLNGALVTMPQSFASLMEQAGEAQIIIKVDPESTGKETEQLCAQNVVIEHNSSKSPTTTLRSILDQETRKKKRPIALVSSKTGENVPPGSEFEPELNNNKRVKMDSSETTRAFLLSLLWKFKGSGGLMSDISKVMDQKAQQHRESCTYTLEKIQEKIIDGTITNLHTLLAYLRCLVALFILSRNKRTVLPQLLKFQESLEEASNLQKKAASF